MISRYTLPEMAAVWSDQNRIRALLQVEIEFLKALSGSRRIPPREIRLLEARARSITPAQVSRFEAVTRHDVAALLEAAVHPIARRAPALSRYLHYGLTSSDLLDTALAMQAVQAADLLLAEWRRVAAALARLARSHRGVPLAARSHGMHSEPTGLAIRLAGFHAEADRNMARVHAAREDIRYGKLSGAAGNFAHIAPAIEARVLRRLGLKAEPVSTQVVPRDRHAAYLCALALSAGAVERIATGVRLLQGTEVGELEEPFGPGQKGSSAMPHKRNPVLSENLCGLARLVRGWAGVALENLALWHERDITHSSVERVVFPDATSTLHFMLRRAAAILEGLKVRPDRMLRNLDGSLGLVLSQKVMLALVDKGMERLRAYRLVQRDAALARERGREFRRVLEADPDVSGLLSGREWDRCFSLKGFLRREGELLRRGGIL